jgi:hypothetical protein
VPLEVVDIPRDPPQTNPDTGTMPFNEKPWDAIVEILNVRLPFEDKAQAQMAWKVQCASGKVANITPFLQEIHASQVDVKNNLSDRRTVIEGNSGLLLPS